MNQFWNLSLLLFLVLGCAEAKYRVKKPFLYEVSKGRLKAHMLGTIHYGVSAEDFPPEFWPYFNGADAFIAEMDTTQGVGGWQRLVESRMVRTPYEKSLIELLDKDSYQRLKEAIKKKGYKGTHTVDGFIDLLNAYGAYAYIHKVEEHNLQLHKSRRTFGNISRLGKSLDFELGMKAREQNKAILDLDDRHTEDFMTCYMETMLGTKEQTLQKLKDFLNGKAVPYDLDELFTTIEAYRLGDEPFFENIKDSSKCLLQDRNEIWVGKIMSHMSTYKRPFIAVGLLHLEHSSETVIDMLKEHGFEVKRIPLVYKD